MTDNESSFLDCQSMFREAIEHVLFVRLLGAFLVKAVVQNFEFGAISLKATS